MSLMKVKLFSVISVDFGSILNVTLLIIQIKDIFKTVMNPDIAVQFSTPYHVIKTSCNKNFLACCTNINNKIIQYSDLESDHNGSFLLKPSPNLELLVNQFNNDTPENGKTSENIYSSKYYDITEMHNIKIPQKNKSLSFSIPCKCMFCE